MTLAVGDAAPPLERTIELPDMVAYAGATWDWHRLHYDSAWLAERGLDRPVVDGQLFGALLAEMLQDWVGPSARLTALRVPLQEPGLRRRDGALHRPTVTVGRTGGPWSTLDVPGRRASAPTARRRRVAAAPAGRRCGCR